MTRKILAVVLGIVTAFVLVAVIEAVGHMIYPPPPDLDPTDREALRDYVEGLPPGAFAFVLAAWGLATLMGGVLACVIAKEKPLRYATIVGAVVLAATLLNLFLIPHPLWFSIAGVGLILVMTLAAGRLGAQSRA